MSVATSTAIALGGAIAAGGTVAGALINSGAAAASTKAQMDALDKQIAERARVTAAAKDAAAISPAEIASMNKLLATQGEQLNLTMKSISKQQELLDAMDPQVKAAGSNLLGILKGEAAKTLAPIQFQQAKQRKDLENRLAATMGPGWQTSSAGMEALSRFDAQSNLALSEAQQTALNSAASIYSNLAGNQISGQAGITTATANAFNDYNNIDKTILAANQNIVQRQTNAELGAVGNTTVDFMGPAKSVGSDQAAIGQGVNSFAAGAAQVAGQIAGQKMQTDNFNNILSTIQANQFASGVTNMGPFNQLPATGGPNSFSIGDVGSLATA